MMNRETVWVLVTAFFTLFLSLVLSGHLLPSSWWFLPWGLSLVLFGLPHGAVDHEVVEKLWQPQPPPRGALAVILTGYLGLSLLVLVGWFIVPQFVFFGFILLTWVHWGTADLAWSWRRDPDYFRSSGHRAVFALWRGALPMLVPLVSDPTFYRATAESTCNLFLPQPSDFSWLNANLARELALGLTLLLGATDFLLARPSARTRGLNLAEGLVLLAFFSLLPALVSVGFYFAFWHGLRHILRLLTWAKWNWTGFVLRALPATLGAVGLLFALAWLVPHGSENQALLGLYLALIAALTVPHALVVTWLDFREELYPSLRKKLKD